jgi:NAD(P)H-hydrate epimerase
MVEACEISAIGRHELPSLTMEQMREVDRAMVEDLHIELVQMMENAGRNLVELAVRRFTPREAVILAGPGGNGGGGLVAARHLANRGVLVSVVLSDLDHMTLVPKHQLDILQRMGIPLVANPPSTELVVDALIGYSLRGDPAGRAAELIVWANDCGAPILALDTPSGLDVTTGVAGAPCVSATATMTLALPKIGLLYSEMVGELYLADISVPRLVYQRMGLDVPDLFRHSTLVQLTP